METCKTCGAQIPDFYPRVNHENEVYCIDCAVKAELMDPLEWCELSGIYLFHHATYKDGIITGFRKWGRGYSKVRIDINGMELLKQ